MILEKEDEKKERETNKEGTQKRLICYRMLKKGRKDHSLNKDTLQSSERLSGPIF